MNLKSFAAAFATVALLAPDANAQRVRQPGGDPLPDFVVAECKDVPVSRTTWCGLYNGAVQEGRQFLSYPVKDPDEARANIDKVINRSHVIIDYAFDTKSYPTFAGNQCKALELVPADAKDDLTTRAGRFSFALHHSETKIDQLPAATLFGARVVEKDALEPIKAKPQWPDNIIGEALVRFNQRNEKMLAGPGHQGWELQQVFCGTTQKMVNIARNQFATTAFWTFKERTERYAEVDDAVKQALALKR